MRAAAFSGAVGKSESEINKPILPFATVADLSQKSLLMERQIEIFFYGLFMDRDALRENGFRPTAARQARVDDFALRLGARATLVPDPGQCVHGMLMRLTHDELDRLYAEPSVAAYRPEPVIAKLANGESAAALCFNLPAAPDALESNPDYAAKLAAVARKLGLPEDYVRSIG